MADEKGITAKKAEDMPEWYSQVILKSEMADYAPIKGCMVLRPLGYSVWENIQNYLNNNIQKLGVKNAYFPLFIPEEFFHREAKHAEGFKPEVAWVEKKHESDSRYAIRPTSETIMYDSYGKWIRSWRDLPLKINQWCNIVRWEVQDCKMFLRSREFLWQEGHCVYETEEERHKETLTYLEEYRKVAEDLLAIPVIKGQKTEKEKFAGADKTYTIESVMPDGKALQLGTSHDLSQGFAKSFNISFIGRDEKPTHPFQNSWGISWRMIGGMIMTHGDDKGLIMPPNAAPNKLVIVPILFDDTRDKVLKKCSELKKKLDKYNPILDDRDEYSPGWKFNQWEMKGVPLRIELGPKDLDKEQAVVVRRDLGKKEFIKLSELTKHIDNTLDTMQKDLFEKAKKDMDSRIVDSNDWEDFMKKVKDKKMVKAPFCGDIECEDIIKDETGGATSRCIANDKVNGKCIHCDKEAKHSVYFCRSY